MLEAVNKFLDFAEGYHLPDFQEYIKNRKQLPSSLSISYAHPVDQKVASVLNSVPVQYSINSVMNLYTDFTLHDLLSNSVHVSSKNFPEVYRILLECSDRLQIPLPRLVVSDEQSSLAFTAGADGNCIIVISSYLIHSLTVEELTFVLGHECGHIKNRHVSLDNLAQMLIKGGMNLGVRVNPALAVLLLPMRYSIGLPLAAWSRSSEITADRSGLSACRNLQAAEMALFKLAGGAQTAGRIDVDDFIRKHEEVKDAGQLARLKGYLASHPYIYQRIQALRIFASSQIYQQATGVERSKDALDRATLERKTAAILKV